MQKICQAAKERDDLAFGTFFDGKGMTAVSYCGKPIDMPVRFLLPAEMMSQPGTDPAGSISAASIDVITRLKQVNRASGSERNGGTQRYDECIGAFSIWGADSCVGGDRNGGGQSLANSCQLSGFGHSICAGQELPCYSGTSSRKRSSWCIRS